MKKTPAQEDRFVIIMAGGRGERFWPVSREKTPKQLVKLLSDRSFLQQTFDRITPLVPVENVIVITNAVQAAEVRKQLPELPKANVIGEPCGRDTCAAVALGAAVVGARSTRAVMAVLPADHVIPDTKRFQRTLKDAFDLAGRGQAIVTIGIHPTGPETGYGYIRVGHELPAPKGAGKYRTGFFKAEGFKEKPDLERAVEYVNSGHYRWNAGMFVWSFVTIANALEAHQPELNQACHRWFEAATKGKLLPAIKRDYPELPKVSVDYAIMEQAHNVVVADGEFAWDDLGAWPALARHLKQDREGNATAADLVHVDSARNVVVDARTKQRGLVALVGLRDTVVVQTDDAVLIAAKDQAQKIKQLVKKLGDSKDHAKLV